MDRRSITHIVVGVGSAGALAAVGLYLWFSRVERDDETDPKPSEDSILSKIKRKKPLRADGGVSLIESYTTFCRDSNLDNLLRSVQLDNLAVLSGLDAVTAVKNTIKDLRITSADVNNIRRCLTRWLFEIDMGGKLTEKWWCWTRHRVIKVLTVAVVLEGMNRCEMTDTKSNYVHNIPVVFVRIRSTIDKYSEKGGVFETHDKKFEGLLEELSKTNPEFLSMYSYNRDIFDSVTNPSDTVSEPHVSDSAASETMTHASSSMPDLRRVMIG